jgi:hypothetical protein
MSASSYAQFTIVFFQQINCDMPYYGKVFSAIVFAYATMVLIKRHIQTPMQAVLYSPMLPYRIAEGFYVF